MLPQRHPNKRESCGIPCRITCCFFKDVTDSLFVVKQEITGPSDPTGKGAYYNRNIYKNVI